MDKLGYSRQIVPGTRRMAVGHHRHTGQQILSDASQSTSTILLKNDTAPHHCQKLRQLLIGNGAAKLNTTHARRMAKHLCIITDHIEPLSGQTTHNPPRSKQSRHPLTGRRITGTTKEDKVPLVSRNAALSYGKQLLLYGRWRIVWQKLGCHPQVAQQERLLRGDGYRRPALLKESHLVGKQLLLAARHHLSPAKGFYIMTVGDDRNVLVGTVANERGEKDRVVYQYEAWFLPQLQCFRPALCQPVTEEEPAAELITELSGTAAHNKFNCPIEKCVAAPISLRRLLRQRGDKRNVIPGKQLAQLGRASSTAVVHLIGPVAAEIDNRFSAVAQLFETFDNSQHGRNPSATLNGDTPGKNGCR